MSTKPAQCLAVGQCLQIIDGRPHQDACQQYVDNYARYWRRFFDPIAVRLDDAADGSLELTTFILPLIDNSIYNRLRESLLRQEDQQPLVIPHIEPAPVLQFSANLRDEFWQKVARDFSEFFRRYGGASAADQERRATMSGLGRLYPLIVSGVADIESADRRHAQLFGFRPLHPPAGRWVWQDEHLASSVDGSAWRQRQPGYDPERPFGLMQAIESMQSNMQFEEAGLRSTIRWKLR